MKLDLGCGESKHPGFLGIDKRPLEGVDLVCDFDQGFPLPENSVEFVIASRSLAYSRDLPALLSEIYRVCIHKAVVCMLVPYAHHFRHRSNPYLRQLFDESSPRYWTNSFWEAAAGARCPPLSAYGGEEVPYDFRLLRMELFYSPPYRPPLYDEEELEGLKSFEPNVVDEMMFHLVVCKAEMSPEELHQLSRQGHEEPVWAASLRSVRESEPEEGGEEESAPPSSRETRPADPRRSPPLPPRVRKRKSSRSRRPRGTGSRR
ncbi:hypothetical protein ACP26L_27125 [Paenibacillus sp. S-38]|uniref:hypothetical protein n=1 Tax=Paenibacillus sp. S-38 TaxID=3416710 RepID=UPI003CF9A098